MGVRAGFLERVDGLQRALRISDRHLSLAATGNPQHLLRIRRGESVTLATIERLEAEMDRLASDARLRLSECAPEPSAEGVDLTRRQEAARLSPEAAE